MPPYQSPYAALNDFVAPARSKAQIWRILGGLLIAAAFGVLASQAILAVVVAALGRTDARSALLRLATGSTPAGVIELLFSYVPLAAGIALGLWLMSRRGLFSLIGPLGPAARNFLWVATPMTLLWLAVMPLSVQDGTVHQNLTVWQQLPWLPFAVLGLLIQTGTEELLFRGYLQQHLAARFRSRWVWMVLPALLFGLVHYSQQQFGYVAWAVVAWSALFGLVAADLTARTGNLGAAIGLHFANNASAVLMVGLADNLGGLALYTSSVDPSATAMPLLFLGLDAVTVVVGWGIARLILRV
ncbi:MAG: type II CAAX endopeptidase family protein [bacterium]